MVAAAASRSAQSGSAANRPRSTGDSAVVTLQSKSVASAPFQTITPPLRAMISLATLRCASHHSSSWRTHGAAAEFGEAIRISHSLRASPRSIAPLKVGSVARLFLSRKTRIARVRYQGRAKRVRLAARAAAIAASARL